MLNDLDIVSVVQNLVSDLIFSLFFMLSFVHVVRLNHFRSLNLLNVFRKTIRWKENKGEEFEL